MPHSVFYLLFQFAFPDKKAACFALGGALKARKMWTLKKCEIECCNVDNCNTQNTTLSQIPIRVFYTDGNEEVNKFSYVCIRESIREAAWPSGWALDL